MTDRAPAALVAIPICAGLLFVASAFGIAYARRWGTAWHGRVPVVGFDVLETSSVEGRIYQGFMLLTLSFIPTVALIHFWRIVNDAHVKAGEVILGQGSVWNFALLGNGQDPARICSEADTCTGNATVLPGLEPVLLMALTIVAVSAALAQWLTVLKGAPASNIGGSADIRSRSTRDTSDG
jgi:hypothetical protein